MYNRHLAHIEDQAKRARTILILNQCHIDKTFTKRQKNVVLVTQQHKGKQSNMSHQRASGSNGEM